MALKDLTTNIKKIKQKLTGPSPARGRLGKLDAGNVEFMSGLRSGGLQPGRPGIAPLPLIESPPETTSVLTKQIKSTF